MNEARTPTVGSLIPALEARARAANSLVELGFSMANDSYSLLPFRQAFVYRAGGGGLLTVSGLARPAEDSPYLLWLRRTWPWLQQQLGPKGQWLAPRHEDMPDVVREGWREWWPAGIYVLPLFRRSGEIQGWVCWLLEQPPDKVREQALQQLGQSWAYCWEMLAGNPRPGLRQRWRSMSRTRRSALVLLLSLLPLLPVRQTVLAPAEIVSLDAMAVAAPLDGVVKAVHVRPNQEVEAGELLFSLDDTVLRNKLEVAKRSVAVADAELTAARQRVFDDPGSQSALALLSGRAQAARLELAAIEEQLGRIDIKASHDGVAVFGDPNDWLGRPVSTGERIMLLANPEHPGINLYLSVADAIALEIGAPVTLFLTVDPLSPLRGRVIQTSYQALPSPQGVASYRLLAAFDADVRGARIGLQGTAKLYGERVPLGYYLLRRPLATLREWTGL